MTAEQRFEYTEFWFTIWSYKEGNQFVYMCSEINFKKAHRVFDPLIISELEEGSFKWDSKHSFGRISYDLVGRFNVFVPLLLPIIKIIHETNAKIEAEKKMCKERRNCLRNPYFSDYKTIVRTNIASWKTWKISPKEIGAFPLNNGDLNVHVNYRKRYSDSFILHFGHF